MRIDRVRIQNLRGIEDAELVLDPSLTILVGANNAGKTTVLDAVAAVLTYRRGHHAFLDTDFRAESELSDVRLAKPIQITLRLVPSVGRQFESGELGADFKPNTEGGVEHIRVRLEAFYSKEEGRVETALRQLDPTDTPVETSEGLPGFPWKENLLFRAFGPNRDLERGMGGRWSDWSLILNDVRPDEETLKAAAGHFSEGSRVLLEKTPRLGEIRDALRPSGESLGLPGSEVRLSATAQDPAELLQQVRVELSLPGASRGFSAERHGLGTQGALLFAIYRLQVSRLLDKAPAGASGVLTVEEPEAHLHPTAQRKMAQQISDLPGQVIVTSHSPDFVQRATGRVALLRSVAGRTLIREIKTSHRSFEDHPRAVFGRCVVLAEGREALVVPIFAEALGLDIDGSGVEVLNCGGQTNLKRDWLCFGPQGLSLPTVVLADGDRPDLEEVFLDAAGVETPEDAEERAERLREHNYFCCEPGECIEFEFARVEDGRYVDQASKEQDGLSLDEWLERKAEQRVADNWVMKIKKRFEIDVGKAADLAENALVARAYRLSRTKTLPVEVARLIAKEGGEKAIPPRFRTAIKVAVELAKGLT